MFFSAKIMMAWCALTFGQKPTLDMARWPLRMSWARLPMTRPGLEPGISGSGGRRPIHYATGPAAHKSPAHAEIAARVGAGPMSDGDTCGVRVCAFVRRVLAMPSRVRAQALTRVPVPSHACPWGGSSPNSTRVLAPSHPLRLCRPASAGVTGLTGLPARAGAGLGHADAARRAAGNSSRHN